MSIKLKKLIPDDVTHDYLETLNDSEYMKYSRNSGFKHTLQSQRKYIKSFDDGASNRSLLFGIFFEETLVGTLTVYFADDQQIANVGLLIFKPYSSKGFGRLALSAISRWFNARFPTYVIQVGTNARNLGMARLSISCGFEVIPSETAQNLLFQLPKRHELDGPFEDLNRYSNGKVLFFASDVGGSENLMEFYLRIEKEKSLIVEGGGCEVFDYFGIPYTNSTEMDYSDYNSFIFSTGSDNMRLSKIRNSFSDQSFNHLCILDNWVNFSNRFSRSEMTIPKKVAVTNEVAFQIAKQQLPDSEVILVHDFRLERLRDIRTVNQFRDPNRILVVLEPERPEIEGLGQITKREQLLAIKRAVNLAQHMGIDEIVIRVHPKMVANFSITDQYESNQKVTLSKNPRIEDDLSTTVAVVGLSSAVLYASASLGIPTYSVIPFDRNSWIGKFGNINYLGEGSP